VIDPEGDYATLESLPGVVLFAGDETPPRLSDVARALRHPDTSTVIYLSTLTHEEKLAYVAELLSMLTSLRRSTGLPHWIVVDEAHYFLSAPDATRTLDLELGAYFLITYRPSLLDSELLAAVETILATPLTDPEEVYALTTMCGAEGGEAAWAEILASLGIDEAVRLARTQIEGGMPQRFTIAPRLTSHVRHRAKYLDVPMPEERAFFFTCNGQNMGPPARTLKEFVQMQRRLPLEALQSHAERGDFSRWIGTVFGDQPLAAAIGEVEERFRKGGIRHFPAALIKPSRDRYDITV